MIDGLRECGVEVFECHAPLWRGIEDRVRLASGEWRSAQFAVRLWGTYSRLLRQYARDHRYDIMVVGYPGMIDIWLARLLSAESRKPLVWDVFMSAYLIAEERNLHERSRITVSMIGELERRACRIPNRLVIDTPAYAAWFQKVFGVATERFRLVPTGADDRVFCPVGSSLRETGSLRVIYYGSFIANHGVAHIVEAARLLEKGPYEFVLIGDGPDRPEAIRTVQRRGQRNVTFVDWLERPQLIQRIAGADIFLGAFGETQQSLMTIQNKVYEGLAMRMPVVTGDSATVRAVLTHGQHAYLVPRGNPAAIATAITELSDDPKLRGRIASGGHELFRAQFTISHVGEQFKRHLQECLAL